MIRCSTASVLPQLVFLGAIVLNNLISAEPNTSTSVRRPRPRSISHSYSGISRGKSEVTSHLSGKQAGHGSSYSDYPLFPPYSDGTLPSSSSDSRGITDVISRPSFGRHGAPPKTGSSGLTAGYSGQPQLAGGGAPPRGAHRHQGGDEALVGGGDVKSKLVVRTSEGAVMGRRVDNKVSKPYLAFWSIPYAEPPLGQLRFQSPRPHPRWQGIRMATEFKDACLGYLLRLMVGDEDCLHLNVFVPDEDQVETRDSGDGRQVVFWIHGGAFIHGSEFVPIYYAPGTFTDRGFIFVSINYRLGPLGFISTDDNVIPGNFAFKDQVMALRWVRNNIRAFGGDPNRVHIIGQSGGGASVHALSVSPMAQGLFASAISMSGSLFTFWGHNPRGRPLANHLARHLDCPTGDTRHMLKCLRNRGAKEITSSIQSFFFLGVRYAVPMGAVIDGYADDPFMPQHPLDLLASGKVHPVPHIFGTVPREMSLYMPAMFYDEQIYQRTVTDWENECGMLIYAHSYLDGAVPNKESTAPFCKRGRELYFPNGELDPPDQNGELLGRFFTDAIIRSGVYMAALIHAKFSSAPTYVYSWDHVNEGAMNILDGINFFYNKKLQFVYTNTTRTRSARLAPGSSHTDDMALLFDPPLFKQKLTGNDVSVKSFVAAMLESFWKTGKPSANNTDWPSFGQADQRFMSFTTAPSVKQFQLTRDQVQLFADWYDLYHSQSERQVPSLSAALGFASSGRPHSPAPDSAIISDFGTVGHGQIHHSYGPPPPASHSSYDRPSASNNGGLSGSTSHQPYGFPVHVADDQHQATGYGFSSASSGTGAGGHVDSTDDLGPVPNHGCPHHHAALHVGHGVPHSWLAGHAYGSSASYGKSIHRAWRNGVPRRNRTIGRRRRMFGNTRRPFHHGAYRSTW